METIGFTLHTIGEVLIAVMVLRVHHKVSKEHKVDDYVLNAMKREHVLGFVGIGLIVTGFTLQLLVKL